MRYLLLTALLAITCLAVCQESYIVQDPAAGDVLERVAKKTGSLASLQTDFELIVADRKEGTSSSSSGKLLMKQKKYKLNSQGSEVYFDGKTMWTFVPENNEVTLTEPEDANSDFLSNPAAFFDNYKADFKYRYVREAEKNGALCHEIDLFPKDLNQPYSRIKVFINKKTDLPASISSIGKDGVDYTVSLKNVIINQQIADTEFTFDPRKYKKIEVVDLRGL